jgi:Tol biopolymer transport system component
MVASRRFAAVLTVTLVAAAGCSSAGTSSYATSASAVECATALSKPTATVTPTSTPNPSPTPMSVLAGEPWIVYVWFEETQALFLTRPDGTDVHRILEDISGKLAHPDWSPDGQKLAFEREMEGDGVEVWTAHADGTNAEKAIGCLQAPCLQIAHPAWSPDGSELAYTRIDTTPALGSSGDRLSIEVIDLATGARRVVARTPPVGAEYIEYGHPRWSPDGTQIVFSVIYTALPLSDGQPSTGSVIAVARADGSEVDAPRMVTDRNLFAAYPDWSPDGKRIVFNTYALGYHPTSTEPANLYTIHPDGSGLTQITHFGSNDTGATLPTWTPDGTQIMFVQITRDPTGADPNGFYRIGLIDPDGSNLTVVPDVPGTNPRLRPTP